MQPTVNQLPINTMEKTINLDHKTIVISRTDSIGDVILTLPLCVWLKQKYPTAKLLFLGSSYTQSIVQCVPEINDFLDWKVLESLPVQDRISYLKNLKADVFLHVFPRKELAHLAKKAGIPYRIGTSHRTFHLLTCNVRPNFTRRNSPLHESQLNFELIRSLGLNSIPSMEEMNVLVTSFKAPKTELPEEILSFLNGLQKTYILHPKSQGSALEWGIDNYIELAKLLLSNGYKVVFTGTEVEGVQFRNKIPEDACCRDTSGKLTLNQLIQLIDLSNGLIACSTGPLHISGVLGKQTVGLYSPRKPIHPGRWKPIGKNATTLVFDENCALCGRGKSCDCITKITPTRVFEALIGTNIK